MKRSKLREIEWPIGQDSISFKVNEGEASLIVTDRATTISTPNGPEHPIVCAVVGPEKYVLKKKKEYENDFGYFIDYVSASD